MNKIFTRFIIWCLHKLYLKQNQPILYIRGTGKDFPKYLLYTENPNVYKRMDDF